MEEAYRLRTLPVAPPGGLNKDGARHGGEPSYDKFVASVLNLAHLRHVDKESACIRGNSKGRDVENGGNTFLIPAQMRYVQ
jgi:hypothetical protein